MRRAGDARRDDGLRRRRVLNAHARRRLSLQARSLLASSLALFAFLGLTGFALDQAFYESSLKELSYRLRSHVYAYLKDTDVSVSGKIIPPEFPPDSRFDRPQSGLYATIVGAGGRWSSPSALSHPMPAVEDLKPGEERFTGPTKTELGTVFTYSIAVRSYLPGFLTAGSEQQSLVETVSGLRRVVAETGRGSSLRGLEHRRGLVLAEARDQLAPPPAALPLADRPQLGVGVGRPLR